VCGNSIKGAFDRPVRKELPQTERGGSSSTFQLT
jgi:hypothetical protein